MVVIASAAIGGALAAPASAQPPLNYGTCVSTGQVDPTISFAGPLNSAGSEASGFRGGSTTIPFALSNGHSRFQHAQGCRVVPGV